MGKFQGIMIATDLDGTFLASGGKVVPRNVEVIRHFCDEGGLFTIATGRQHNSLHVDIPGLDTLVNIPAVVTNGMYLYDYQNGCRLSEQFMDTAQAMRMILFAREHYPKLGVRASAPVGYLVDGKLSLLYEPVQLHDVANSIRICPVEEWGEHHMHKVVFYGDEQEVDALRADFEASFGDVVEYHKSCATYLEIQKKGVSKGRTLLQLKAALEAERGYPITMYCVGDYGNDIAMLRVADVAVCPANAIDEVKDICDMVLCDHNEGVIADLIERLS